jgi:hypothetical protein
MEGDEYVKGKDKNQLLKGLLTDAQVGSQVHEQQKMAIFVRCTEDLEASVRQFTDSSNKLSNRILWLNVILGLFTIVGTALAIVQMIKQCK